MSEGTSDPRNLGGDIAGPGGPHDWSAVVLDTRNAVLLEGIDVSLFTDSKNGESIALLLQGRINRSQDRAKVLYLFDADGAAALVSELIGLMARASKGPESAVELAAMFQVAFEKRMEAMPR